MTRTIVEHIDLAHLVPGGIDTCITDIVRLGDESDISIIGITSDVRQKLGQWYTQDVGGKTVMFMPVARFNRLKRGKLRIPHSLRFGVGLLRHRKTLKGRFVQVHRIETGMVCRFLGAAKVVQFIHNDGVALTGSSSDSVWRYLRFGYRFIERVHLPSVAGVVLFNKTDAPRLQKFVPEIHISTTWYDESIFWLGADPYAERIPIVWVGRFEAQKDPILAIETLAALADVDRNARLTMIGDGSLRPSVERRAQDLGIAKNVDFAGVCSRQEVSQMLRGSKALLMTSHYEGSPRVMLEALACGTPVVATEEADTDRRLRVDANGVAVAGRDPRGLARGLLDVRGIDRASAARSVAAQSAAVVIPDVLSVGTRSKEIA